MSNLARARTGPLTLAAAVALTGCAGRPAGPDAPPQFTAESFNGHVRVLASDEFEGRRPASAGEEKTVAYLEQQFRAAGLQPGLPGGFRQSVPFLELAARPADELRVTGPRGDLALRYGDDAVYWTTRPQQDVVLGPSELVFVGYGIVEPLYGWNDYAGVDMRGKTAVILVNDPGFATGDPALFKGRAMTYHGRWTYKFEEASRQGAAGAIIVHEEEPAAYPWDVVRNGAVKPQLLIDEPGRDAYRIAVEGWMTRPAAERLFAAAGLDFEAQQRAAAQRGFRAVPLGVEASTSVRNAVRRAASSNVVVVLPGAKRPDEYVLYTAHWDHFGRALAFGGDAVFNGAIDNATGTAALLELARAFGAARPRPERSVMFVAFTGEEYGLLGSEYFAAHPPVPLAAVAGGVNMDALYLAGRTRDVTVFGIGSSELEDSLRESAGRQGRVLRPEPTPEKGYYYRSDHFNLARRGVPMLYVKSGVDLVGRGEEAGRRWAAEYVAQRYHKPSDEFDPQWDVGGVLDDLALFFDVGYRLSRDSAFPAWYPDNEFRAVREQSRAAAAAR